MLLKNLYLKDLDLNQVLLSVTGSIFNTTPKFKPCSRVSIVPTDTDDQETPEKPPPAIIQETVHETPERIVTTNDTTMESVGEVTVDDDIIAAKAGQNATEYFSPDKPYK